MHAEHAIVVDRVSKKFARSLKKAMWYGVLDIARAGVIPRRHRSETFDSRIERVLRDDTPPSALTNVSKRETSAGLRESEFWALKDVSFEIKRGECVGLIGANGAGKSTLFSILSGIYGPTEGRVMIRGRLQALIALGAGFHPLLTGRENIYLNASILGLKSREIDERLEKIIQFADIGPFIDAPVKMYSSGMLVRLGFAVAAHLDPDVLLIDEVLAVGDAAFQQKCQEYSLNLVRSGKTIMIVAHNLLVIQALCSRTIWLDKGQVRRIGPTNEVVDAYKEAAVQGFKSEGTKAESRGRVAIIHDVQILQNGEPVGSKLRSGLPLRVVMPIYTSIPIEGARIWMTLAAGDQLTPVVGASMYNDGHYLNLSRGENVVILDFDPLPLQTGFEYRVTFGLRDYICHTMYADSYASPVFHVEGGPPPCLNGVGEAQITDPKHAMVSVPYRWQVTKGAELHRHHLANAIVP